MKPMTIIKNLMTVSLSQSISILSNIVISFLLPMILDIADYGYFKIYTLYLGYTALLHFGFADGILLKLGGTHYEKLDQKEIRIYSYFFIAFQFLIGLTVFIASLFFLTYEYRFVFCMIAINLITINLTTYYQFISQATFRFKEYSQKNITVALVKGIIVTGLFMISKFMNINISYVFYLIILNILDMMMLCWYIYIYRDITFGDKYSLTDYKKSIIDIFKKGILLTVAYQVSHLIFNLDKQFVSMLFSPEIFAGYAFAYNIITLISTFISTLSLILFPVFKSIRKHEISNYYSLFLRSVICIVGFSMISYYPLEILIQNLLPKYTDSLVYIKVLLPSLLFISSINIVMFTVYKVIDCNGIFFRHGIYILVLSIVLNTASFILFDSALSISSASLITMMVWFIYESISIRKYIHIEFVQELLYIIILGSSFFLLFHMFTGLMAAISYLLIYIVITVIFFKKDFHSLMMSIKK